MGRSLMSALFICVEAQQHNTTISCENHMI
jgi:hypothetical protein